MKKKKLVIILFFILIFSVVTINFNIGSDYFWHTKMGEYIVNFKKLPTTCLYSWYGTENNLMFTLHEWLYEIIIYGFYRISKIWGPFLYLVTFISLLVAFIVKSTLKKLLNKNLILFIPFIALATIELSFHALPRPHIISWLLVAITIYLSYDLYENNSKKIYFLPLITIIWGNVHGGSSCLSYMIPGLFLVVGLFNFNKWGLTNHKLPINKIKHYIIIIILNMLALLINPYGLDMILYPYINMVDTTMKSIINEWHPPSIKNGIGVITYIYIFYNLYIYYRGKEKIKLIDLSLFLVFVYLSTSSYRFIPLMVIVSFYTTLNYLNNDKKPIKGNSLIITIITGILLISIFQINNILLKLNSKEIDDKLINTIKEIKPKHLYNDYNIGGYLIYNEIDVFIDGRADAYSKDNLKDAYSLMIGDGTNTKELLSKYNFDLLITENNCYLDKFLKNDIDYKFLIKDNHYSIYQKNHNE